MKREWVRVIVAFGFSVLAFSFAIHAADPVPLTAIEKAYMNAYSVSYCNSTLSQLQQLSNAYKGTWVASYYESLYKIVSSQCANANKLRERDAAYQAWLVAKSAKPSPSPSSSPAPAPSSGGSSSSNVTADSEKLFGALDANGPNDPYWANQRSSGYDRVTMLSAWKVNRDCGSVPIWVFDTGADPNHSEISSALRKADGYNYISNNTNYNDDHWHGTFVTGIIAAASNNRTGTAGVCWRGSVAPIKVMNAQGMGTTSDILRALNTTTNGIKDTSKVKVYNLSISFMDGVAYDLQSSGMSKPFLDAVKAASQKNVLMVVAAGNSAQVVGNTGMISSLPKNLLVVGATDANDKLASFSNYGGITNIFGPGVNMISTNPGNKFSQASGTSFSTPLTTGIAALFIQANPNLSASDVAARILNSADVLSDPKQPKMPRINAGRLLSGK